MTFGGYQAVSLAFSTRPPQRREKLLSEGMDLMAERKSVKIAQGNALPRQGSDKLNHCPKEYVRSMMSRRTAAARWPPSRSEGAPAPQDPIRQRLASSHPKTARGGSSERTTLAIPLPVADCTYFMVVGNEQQ